MKGKACDLLVGSREKAVQLLLQHTSSLPTKEMALTEKHAVFMCRTRGPVATT